jgi:hypothetical protein
MTIAGSIWLLLVTAFEVLVTVYFSVVFIHEFGHAAACKAQGYQVLTFCLWCLPRPFTNCSNNTGTIVIAGTVASLIGWTTATLMFVLWLLPRYRRRALGLFVVSFGWAVWSFTVVGEVIDWARLVHLTSRVPPPDTAHFATITHIDPRWIIIGAWMLTALMLSIIVPISRRTVRTFLALRNTNQCGAAPG